MEEIQTGNLTVNLFATHENAHCPLYFTLQGRDAPLCVDALADPWPNMLLYAFPPLSDSPQRSLGEGTEAATDLHSTQVTHSTMADGDVPAQPHY